MTVEGDQGNVLCKVLMEWPDPFRHSGSGIAATARILSPFEGTYATVVARTPAVAGQSIALCRSGCEIFGFVDPDGEGRFNIRHRTGVHMLTLTGDLAEGSLVGTNP